MFTRITSPARIGTLPVVIVIGEISVEAWLLMIFWSVALTIVVLPMIVTSAVDTASPSSI